MNLVRFNAVLTWLVANLVIGITGTVPLATAIPLASTVWKSTAPHGRDFAVALTVFLVVTSSLTAVAFFANRTLRRRLATTRRHSVVFWLATIALLLSPTAYFLLT